MKGRSEIDKEIGDLITFSDKVIYKTASIKRYNTTLIIQTQSVLEHMGGVEIIAMLLADYFRKLGVKLDIERVLRMAITHDLDEALYGDIPYDAKYEYGEVSKEFRASLDKMKDFTLKMLLNMLEDKDLAKSYFDLMMEEKGKQTTEAKIVKLADYIDVIIFIDHELSLGNSSVKNIKKKAEQNIGRIIDDILKEAK